MKYLSQLKSFWKLFIPTVVIIVMMLVCAILIASGLIRSVYLTNLEQQLSKSSSFVRQKFNDTINILKAQVSMLEKNENLSIATLYAFDELVKDGSFLTKELDEIRKTIDVSAVAIKSIDSDRAVYSADDRIIEYYDFNSVINQFDPANGSPWYKIGNEYFLVISGMVTHVSEKIGRIFLFKKVGSEYLSEIANALNAKLILLNKNNDVISFSSDFSLSSPIVCNNESSKTIRAADGIRYYYECTGVAAVDVNAPIIAHLYDGSILWKTIRKTNVYLWFIGAILIGISVFLNFIFSKSFTAPIKALAKLMCVEESDDLPQAFDMLSKKTLMYQDELAKRSCLAAVGQSTAMVAHDVRKPLTSMKALLTVLPSIKDDPEQVKKMIANVDRSIVQTNTMLNEILDFSRDSTALELKIQDPQGMITSALSDALRNHAGAFIGVLYDLKHRYCMRVDGPRTIRVLTNILDNALDAMKRGDEGKIIGQIKIGSYEVERDGKRFIGVTIADDGPGIPENILPKIFDPFFTNGKKGGTGLGLAICHKVINMHGGKIEAGRGDSGCGTKFTIELPSSEERAFVNDDDLIHNSKELEVFRIEEESRVEYGDTANTAEFMRLNKERGRESYLLIVDDEPLFRETIRGMMGTLSQVKDHIKVIEADSGETGLKLFEARGFDYVIADIDLGLACMNGYKFAQTVLQKYPDAHVLIHSNKRKEEMDVKIRETASHVVIASEAKQSSEHRNVNEIATSAGGGLAMTSRFMGFLPKPMKASELLQFLACKTFESVQVDPSTSLRPEPVEGFGASKSSKETIASQGGFKKKILLLNDDREFNLSMRLLLKGHGVQVLDTTNVSDAFEQFLGQKFDAIVSDVNLGSGEPDGYEFLTKVREKNGQIPFIFASGYRRTEVWPRAEELGATGCLQMPFELSELKEALKI